MRRVLNKLFFALAIVGVAVGIHSSTANAANLTLTGTLRDPANAVVSGAYVYVTAPANEAIIYGPVATDTSGYYSLPIAEAGNYDVHFIAPSGKIWSNIVDSNLSLSMSQTINKNFAITQMNTLSGTIKTSDGTVVGGVTVKLGIYQTSTSSDGTYSLSVPAGSYALSIIGNDAAINGMYNFTLQQSTAGVNLSSGNQILDLTIKTAQVDVSPLLNNGTPNTGKVMARATSGTTSLYPTDPGTTVSLAWSDDVNINASYGFTPGTLVTIAGASFSAAGLEASSYMTSICKTITSSSLYDCIRTPLTVRDSMSLQIPSYGAAVRTFSGTLVDASSNPIPNARITLYKFGDQSVTTATNANGEFTMNAMPKKYSLKIDISSFNLNSYNTYDSVSLTQPSANPSIDLTASNKTLALTLPTAKITVAAVDTNGYPAYEAAVYSHSNTGAAYLYTGDPGFAFNIQANTKKTTASDNVVTVNTLKGANYSAKGLGTTVLVNGSNSICVMPLMYQYWNCLTSPLTISGDVNITVGQ